MAMNEEQRRAKAEAELCELRIIELRLRPVQGNFDADHLKEINRRIFQDLPDLGFKDVTPGIYRPEVATGKDWMKMRGLESAPGSFFVAYSKMDAASLKRLDAVLEAADPVRLSSLSTKDFTQAIAKLYSELDYIHPFPDGNSRTLRAFTSQLATEAGYDIDWTRFAESPAGRDILYIARDLAVFPFAKAQIEHPNNLMKLVSTAHRLEGNRTLEALLVDVTKPSRAVAFERYPEAEALARHPELNSSYQMLKSSRQFLTAKYSANPVAIEKGMKLVVEQLQVRLDKNEVPQFDMQKAIDRTVSIPKGPERER
jgi:cell filamentation protein